jgi:hypothetical protein
MPSHTQPLVIKLIIFIFSLHEKYKTPKEDSNSLYVWECVNGGRQTVYLCEQIARTSHRQTRESLS